MEEGPHQNLARMHLLFVFQEFSFGTGLVGQNTDASAVVKGLFSFCKVFWKELFVYTESWKFGYLA
jgi:hypothetical protein